MSDRGYEIERFEEIASTNSYLMERARQGAPAGLVAVADHQTAGRGRLDRRWESPPGSSLLVSVLLREPISPATAHLVTGAVALAAAAAAERVSGLRPSLKWPNDLVVDGRKLAGILAEVDHEAPGGAPGTTAVVVGVGMNLSWPGPEGAGGTCLDHESGQVVDRDELLEALLDELGGRLDLVASPEGCAVLSTELAASLSTLGEHVSVETATGTVVGRATGLSPAGHLLVETAGGMVEVVTGDLLQLRDSSGPSDAAE
jgi:BirA family biotin operon repressor/biotin-[acetyl-CoA-carboxylase] ligase